MEYCQYCNDEFENKRKCSCHERLCKLRPDYQERLARFKQGCGKSKGKELVERINYELTCEVCGKTYYKRLTPAEFKHIEHFNCSRSCANKRIHSDETKEKIKNSIKLYNKEHYKEYIDKYCKHCNIKLGKNNKSGYCKKCVIQTTEYKEKLSKSLKANPNVGGYRKGSGTGKSGWYKGYYCDSSWELAFVIYNLEHNIKFERNKKMFPYTYNGEEHNYLPDWLVDGKYVEIKGHDSEQWQAKIEQFPKDLTLEVLYRDNMQKYLEYVRDKYGNNFIELYDNSKPVKNINDQVATWFHLKNEKTGKFIQLYVFKENYDIYLNNGWLLGRYSPSVHKNYTVIKHTNVRRVSEIEKEKILRNMID